MFAAGYVGSKKGQHFQWHSQDRFRLLAAGRSARGGLRARLASNSAISASIRRLRSCASAISAVTVSRFFASMRQRIGAGYDMRAGADLDIGDLAQGKAKALRLFDEAQQARPDRRDSRDSRSRPDRRRE
jgi:hypothetical protein